MDSAYMSAVQKEQTVSLYLVCGDDDFLVNRRVKELVGTLCPPEEQSLGMETICGDVKDSAEALIAIKRCREAVQTLSFFGGGKTVWLQDAVFLKNGFNASDELKEALKEFGGFVTGKIPSGHVLVISAPKPDGRGAFFKTCQKAGRVERFDLLEKDYEARPIALELAHRLLKEQGLAAADKTVQRLIEKTGFITRGIVQEIEKLAVYMGGPATITDADVDAIVSNCRDSMAWDLADAAAEGRTADALRILRQLVFQGESVVPLFMAMENRFRELLLFRDCLDLKLLQLSGTPGRRVTLEWSENPKVTEAFEKLPSDPRKIHPYRAGLLAGQAQRFTTARLEKTIELIKQAHLQSVSVGSIRSELLLELVILRMG